MFKWFKYWCIITLSMLTNKTVVSFFGSTYIVSGNFVKRFGGKK